MRPVVTDRVACSVGLSVGLSVSAVRCTKTAEPFEMPFRMLSRVDPRNHVLDWDADAPTGRALLVLGVSSPVQRTGFRGIG